jgi:hypothetical protein
LVGAFSHCAEWANSTGKPGFSSSLIVRGFQMQRGLSLGQESIVFAVESAFITVPLMLDPTCHGRLFSPLISSNYLHLDHLFTSFRRVVLRWRSIRRRRHRHFTAANKARKQLVVLQSGEPINHSPVLTHSTVHGFMSAGGSPPYTKTQASM